MGGFRFRMTSRHLKKLPFAFTMSGLVAFLVVQQASVDLAEGDRQRFITRFWSYQRPDELEDAFILFLVVAVDLACALSGEDHQSVL